MEKQNIASYFNSQEFLKILATVVPEKHSSYDIASNVGALMEMAFNFMKLTNFTANPEQVTDLLVDIAGIHNEKDDRYYNLNYNAVFLNHYCKFNSIDPEQLNNPDYGYVKTDMVFSLASNIYKFHGTNSTFITSIKEQGLQPNRSPNEDIEEIDQIFISHGRESIFPCKTAERGDEVFYSTTPKVSYSYAVRSPEWFDMFVGGDSYLTRNYEKAKENIKGVMEQYNLTEQEQEKVGGFFEKYWDVYASEKPTIIAIPGSTDKTLDMAEFAVEMAKSADSIDEALTMGLYISGNEVVDASTKDNIDTSNAIFVEMPDVLELEKQISIIHSENKPQQENETQHDQVIETDISMEAT